jgi:hypothetical protein
VERREVGFRRRTVRRRPEVAKYEIKVVLRKWKGPNRICGSGLFVSCSYRET